MACWWAHEPLGWEQNWVRWRTFEGEDSGLPEGTKARKLTSVATHVVHMHWLDGGRLKSSTSRSWASTKYVTDRKVKPNSRLPRKSWLRLFRGLSNRSCTCVRIQLMTRYLSPSATHPLVLGTEESMTLSWPRSSPLVASFFVLKPTIPRRPRSNPPAFDVLALGKEETLTCFYFVFRSS